MRTHTAVLTNMVMVQDPHTDEILVQERTSCGWEGVTFPGGHVEKGEPFVQSAIREVKEETGLTVWNLKPCGVAQWIDGETDDRYITFLYKTNCYVGALRPETERDVLYFIHPDALRDRPLSLNFDKMLEVFLQEDTSEAYAEWLDDFTAPMRVL